MSKSQASLRLESIISKNKKKKGVLLKEIEEVAKKQRKTQRRLSKLNFFQKMFFSGDLKENLSMLNDQLDNMDSKVKEVTEEANRADRELKVKRALK